MLKTSGRKSRDVWQYGDFQTPPDLVASVCKFLDARGIRPKAILEPTCGRGSFLAGAIEQFNSSQFSIGVEINEQYAQEARLRVAGRGVVEQGDFFSVDWQKVLSSQPGPWLIIGNPPWVTNSELGQLKSSNLPQKTNFQQHQGLDALTGKANFDISEWMLLQQLDWLKQRSGWISMLVKTSVARKVLKQAWKMDIPTGKAAIIKIDAMKNFGAAVDASLLILPIAIEPSVQLCDLYDDLDSDEPSSTIGYEDGWLISDTRSYAATRHLVGANQHYVWRSGVKHDCSKVMELASLSGGNLYTNGYDERVSIEPNYVFPLLKSSDVDKGRTKTDRFMIVTQKEIGAETTSIERLAPKTWKYLSSHSDKLNGRGSVIYRGKPPFSIFGVGKYSFAPWKIAISGFYKNLNFVKVGPVNDKPVMLDDTIYFLPCWSEAEADFVLQLLNSTNFQRLIRSMIFLDEKRPVTADLLKRISIEKVASELGMSKQFSKFAKAQQTAQTEFDFAS